jgi:hypothetical protein
MRPEHRDRLRRCPPGVPVSFVPDVPRTVAGKVIRDFWIEGPVGKSRRPHHVASQWIYALRITHDNRGQPVIGEVRIFPNEVKQPADPTPGRWSAETEGFQARAPRGGITARLMRGFRLRDAVRFLGQVQATLHRDAEAERRQHGEVRSPYLQDAINQWLVAATPPALTPSTHRRAPGFSDLSCARLAREYAQLIASGKEQPITVLAARYRLVKSTVKMRIHLARKRGFLTRSRGQGFGGGVLTEKARQLLRA